MNIDKEAMLRDQLEARGIHSQRVLNVMKAVNRENFIPEEIKHRAYTDSPLPIGHGQTISQPLIVAKMIESLELKATDKVLEIGCGSGYNAALMSLLCRKVYSIEIVPELVQSSIRALSSYSNVEVIFGDGYQGLPSAAPFDKIVLTAAPKEVPQALLDQLVLGGTLIAPIGEIGESQSLIKVKKDETGLMIE